MRFTIPSLQSAGCPILPALTQGGSAFCEGGFDFIFCLYAHQKSLANTVNLWYIYVLVMILKRLILGSFTKEVQRELRWSLLSA